MNWKWTNETREVAYRILTDGRCESCTAAALWGSVPDEPDPPPPPTQDQLDRAEAKADAVVQYLQTHTPAECALYVRQNVTDLPSAKALLEKFAMVLSVLSRGL